MQEILLRSHLIITDIHEEYHIDWCGKLKDTKPKFKNGKPIFIIIGSESRNELNTTDIKMVEKYAKMMTKPKGKEAITTDAARIFIKEENGREKLLGIVTHNHVKTFAPMYDKFLIGE